MTRHPVRCNECGSNFGHDEGCSQANAAMIRDALIAGKSVPGSCHICGGQYGHRRGCKLEDLSLKKEQESAIRCDPGNVSEFDVDCLLHEIDRLREDQSKHWVAANEENDRHIQRIQQLEREIVSLRTMAANLRLESSHE